MSSKAAGAHRRHRVRGGREGGARAARPAQGQGRAARGLADDLGGRRDDPGRHARLRLSADRPDGPARHLHRPPDGRRQDRHGAPEGPPGSALHGLAAGPRGAAPLRPGGARPDHPPDADRRASPERPQAARRAQRPAGQGDRARRTCSQAPRTSSRSWTPSKGSCTTPRPRSPTTSWPCEGAPCSTRASPRSSTSSRTATERRPRACARSSGRLEEGARPQRGRAQRAARQGPGGAQRHGRGAGVSGGVGGGGWIEPSPLLDPQALHSPKVSKVAGDNRVGVSQSRGGDQHVVMPDELAARQQVRPEAGVSSGNGQREGKDRDL